MKWEYRTLFFDASGWIMGGKLNGEKFNTRLNEP
jgi:hypothetical protein